MSLSISIYLALGFALAAAACPGAIAVPSGHGGSRQASPSAATRAGACSGAGANPWTYNFEVSGHPAKVLNDATASFPLDSGVFGATSPAVLSRALKRRFLNDTHAFVDNNVLYIDWDGEGMLFDAGNGPGEAPTLGFGMVFEHLEAEGIERSSIKHVFLTHGHADHLAGVVEDLAGLAPAFPAATIHISSVEYQFWTADVVNRSTSTRPDALWQYDIATAKAVLGAVQHQLRVFEVDEEPFPGITTIPTPWHTPGSVAHVIPDGGGRLVFSGDGLPHRVLGIENPWVVTFSETTPEATVPGRYALLDGAVKERWQLLCGHVGFPGLLFVDNEGVNYQTTASAYMGSGAAMSVCS